MKFNWWQEVQGQLVIEGRRLDAPDKSMPRTGGVTKTINKQTTSITFPSEGHWEITGSVGGASLTFVTLVVKV
jgi:hypothetical protein